MPDDAKLTHLGTELEPGENAYAATNNSSNNKDLLWEFTGMQFERIPESDFVHWGFEFDEDNASKTLSSPFAPTLRINGSEKPPTGDVEPPRLVVVGDEYGNRANRLINLNRNNQRTCINFNENLLEGNPSSTRKKVADKSRLSTLTPPTASLKSAGHPAMTWVLASPQRT